MTPRRSLGDFGERIAAHRLEAGGLRILDRNVRVPGGEIDLLAEEGNDLVFVEVRTRRGAEGSAVESLSAAKLRRMWRSAMAYCDANEIDPPAPASMSSASTSTAPAAWSTSSTIAPWSSTATTDVCTGAQNPRAFPERIRDR